MMHVAHPASSNPVRNRKPNALLTLLLLGLSACLACSNNANPAPTSSAEADTTIDLSAVTGSHQTQTFSKIQRASLLPRAVLEQFGRMADPGEPFNSTDVINPKLPMRRLIVAAVSKQYCIVFYSQGGIVLEFKTAIFELADGKAKVIWVSINQGGFSLRELKEMVESGRMRNALSQWPTAW